jgi:CTP synthase
MREIGIQPDMLICRCDQPINKGLKEKISLFTNVPVNRVISAVDVECLYEVPLVLHAEGLDDQLAEMLNIWSRQPDLSEWERTVQRFHSAKGSVRIGVVGKYVHLKDTYKSLHEALVHGGLANDVRVDFHYLDSESLEHGSREAALTGLDAILVPGGFGDRGVEGKIRAIQFARENKVPFFGICLGMQLAVIEYARNVCGLRDANSGEFDANCEHKVIAFLKEQVGVEDKGGTMRLGAYPCTIRDASLAASVYGETHISERHRHRYEVNNAYRDTLQQHGLVISGTSPDGELVEIVELAEHPYFIACQFHPEFKSRPTKPHPLFTRFVQAAKNRRDELLASVKKESEGSSTSNSIVH